MKRIFFLFSFIISIFFVQAQEVKVKTIGLIQPTISKIERILFLAEQNILSIDTFNILGICHESQTELIAKSQAYIEDNKLQHIKLYPLKNKVGIDSLYTSNSWTEQFSDIFKQTNGIIFLGGYDLLPAMYGHKTLLSTQIFQEAQNFEVSLLFHLTGGSQNQSFHPLLNGQSDYVIFGICLGMQEMNVAAGGTMYQDIPSELYGLKYFEEVVNQPTAKQHKNYWKYYDNTLSHITAMSFHPIKFTSVNFLSACTENTNPIVASVHHQCIKDIAENYHITASSLDGKVIEGIAHNKFRNVYGIQFHTDYTVLYDEAYIFTTDPDNTLLLKPTDRSFYTQIWNDFSRRINNQQ